MGEGRPGVSYLNMGAAPSQTAQALMPLFQKPFTSPAPGKSSLFATAPVLWTLPLMYCREGRFAAPQLIIATDAVTDLGQRLLLEQGCSHTPVAMITVSASTAFTSVQTLKGRLERSALVTVSEKMRVPKRSL